MSFSINNSPFVKFDTTPNDSQVPVLTKTGGSLGTGTQDSKVIPSVIQQDFSRGSQGEVMINAGTLSKLFDMLEQVFRTMREMVSGKNITPDLKANADTSAKVSSGTDPQKKMSTDSGPLPNAADQPKVKPDASPLSQVMPNAADQPKVKPEASPLPKVMPNAADQSKVKPGVNPFPKIVPNGEDQKKVKTDDGPAHVIPPKPTPRFLPPVPQPDIRVTNDANAQVKVEVNVVHCHCPDTRAEHDKGRQPLVTPQPKPDATPQTTVTPQPKLDATSPTTVTPQPKPDTAPQTTVTPQPKPNTPPQTTVKPQPKPDATPPTTVKPQPKPDAMPPTTMTPKPKPDATPPTTMTPQPKPEDTPQPSVNPIVPTPVPDVTSPGPAESHADLTGWSFINRRRART